MAVSVSPTPSSTPTPCKYFTSKFNSTHGPDACAIGVFAAGGALVVIACTLMCFGIILCCCCRKQQRKEGSKRRTKPLIATQAASWFTNSLTSNDYNNNESLNKQLANTQVQSKQNDYPNLPTRGSDKEPNKNTKAKPKIEEGGRGHVYQTLHLDEMDYESMYTHTVPKKHY